MIEKLLVGPGGVVPAVAVVAIGVAGLAWGLARQRGALRHPVSDPRKALALIRCLRTAILGLATVAIGTAWLVRLPALAGLALVIAGEEMLEISVVVGALKAAPGLAPQRRSR